MIKKAFLTELFRAADMRRWNDKIRHIELRELDYQAQKMAIAYVLAKWEELKNPNTVDWITLIERGIFEFLERLVLTDIKPQVQREIEDDEDAYRRLRDMVSHILNLCVHRSTVLMIDSKNICPLAAKMT